MTKDLSRNSELAASRLRRIQNLAIARILRVNFKLTLYINAQDLADSRINFRETISGEFASSRQGLFVTFVLFRRTLC